jgi:hypothetical protein
MSVGSVKVFILKKPDELIGNLINVKYICHYGKIIFLIIKYICHEFKKDIRM